VRRSWGPRDKRGFRSAIALKGDAAHPLYPEQLTWLCQVKGEMNGARLALSQQLMKGATYLARFSRDVGYRETLTFRATPAENLQAESFVH
jgi:hypothetical protein